MRTALATTIAAAILTALWSAHRFTAKPPGVEQLATTSIVNRCDADDEGC
jgi:hypothetical protein